MNVANVTKLLKIIEEHYNQFNFSEDKINAWHMALCDLDDMDVLTAYKTIRRQGNKFPPGVGEIEAEVMRTKKLESSQGAELCWAALMNRKPMNDEIGAQAYDKWGGWNRHGMLPDPKYCSNVGKAQQTIAFARKEYLEIYSQLSERKENNENKNISHAESKALLQTLGLIGNE